MVDLVDSVTVTLARESRSSGQLRGYSQPLSPSGRRSLVSPPPWHFSGEVILVDYRARPDRVRAILPAELELGDEPGHAVAGFGDWQVCGDDGAELDDPVRSQFKEFFILLACELDGAPGVCCPHAWVDRPVALMRGLIQGIPKLFGSIWMTRTIDVGRAGPRRAPGHRFAASLACDDRRLVEARVALRAASADPPALMTRPLLQVRYLPAWDPAQPALRELVTTVSANRELAGIWRGAAELRFLEGAGEDLRDLAPISVGDGHVFSYAETLLAGQLLEPASDR